MVNTPQGPEAQVGEQSLLGNNGRMRSEVKSSLRIDSQQLGELKKHLKDARDITKQWREEMEKLAKAAKSMQSYMGGMGGSGDGGSDVASGDGPNTPKPPEFKNTSQAPAAAPSTTSRLLSGVSKVGGAAAVAAPFISAGMGQLDARIDRGIAYASSADKLNMLTQQMTGMSQMQAMNQRRDLTDYRLGAGGINAAVQFGLTTGQTITPSMAKSIEAIRTSTGFSKSTADILAEQRQMMDPTVANRMFFMGGVNAYNIGGGMKDPLQMRQEVIQRMGLANEKVLSGAFNPGSVTRARMADMGMGEEMQTEILQYAQQQIAFREKGGKGFYDPSKANHRQMMGIEDNLATQQEETERVTGSREEQFMRRQIDNMASLEKSNQDLIRAMASLEDTMSGLIGKRISGRPKQQMVGGALKGIGGAMVAFGGASALATGGFSAPVSGAIAGIGGLLMAGGALLGDPADPEAEGSSSSSQARNNNAKSSANDNSIMVPYGYNGNRISLSELKNKPDFNKLNPRFKDRLLQMMRVNPNVGVGGGTRDPSAQETMFKSRYERTEEDTGLFWDGSFWKHVSGAAAAPPGMSMHEIGLAADLVGDLDWMNAHAGEFGLQHFAGVNNEPWHVQPDDLPRSRSKYEQAGAPWGTDGGYDKEGGSKSASADTGGDHGGGSQPSGVGSGVQLPGLSGMSIQEAMATSRQNSLTRLMAGGGTYPQGSTGGTTSSGGGSKSAKITATAGSGAVLAAEAAYKAGFRGKDLTTIVALAGRESRWDPRAKNPATSDHGMWQINWSANQDLAKSLGASEATDLFNVDLNARVAYALFNQAKGWAKGNDPGFFPWRGSDKGHDNSGPGWDGEGDHMWHADQFLAEATSATAKYQSGDPMFTEPTRGTANSRSGGRTTTNHITSAPTINVAPVINFNGAPSTPDLRNIAQTVSRMIKEEVSMIDLRTA